jgi:predicted nucleotidyltransferase
MRISKQEKEIFVTSIKELIKDAKIYLFGSRINDNIQGGDIDLGILINKNISKLEELKLIISLKNKFIQKGLDAEFVINLIDIVILTPKKQKEIIYKEVTKGIVL